MDHQKLFQATKAKIPNYESLSAEALHRLLGEDLNNPDVIRGRFSDLVERAQDEAYKLYLEYEKAACELALRECLEELVPANATRGEVILLMASNTVSLDRWFLSMTQSRRPRAGKTFEAIVTHLFGVLRYPHTSQPDLGDDRPDFVLPSIGYYQEYASDCIIFTCKRTLRERWRQIVTEGIAAQFFLATIDSRISNAELDRMRNSRVVVVVPQKLSLENYHQKPNVISFEQFFEHHLDPAMVRWRSRGAI